MAMTESRADRIDAESLTPRQPRFKVPPTFDDVEDERRHRKERLAGALRLFGRFGFSASPIVLGLILGRIAEQGFVQGWTIGEATENVFGMFFGRPISMAIIAFIVLSLFYPIFKERWLTKKRRLPDVD